MKVGCACPSLPKQIVEDRLDACLQDASLPPSQVVTKYISEAFSESVTQEVQEDLANIMSDFQPTGFRLMATTSAQVDTRDLLPNILVPTLLIWSDADRRSPMNVAYKIRNAVPGARLVVISSAGHVSNLEKPAQFNTTVHDFCLHLSHM